MQGLVNFSTAIADSIAVLLPAFCYLAACGCFFFFAWTLWTWSQPHSRYHHIHHDKPWIPFVSLILCGVFATFPQFLAMANVSAGTNLGVTLTTYQATTPPNANNVLGNTPDASVINVVTLFQDLLPGVRCGLRVLGDHALAEHHQRTRQRLTDVLRHPVRVRRALHQHRHHRQRCGVVLPDRWLSDADFHRAVRNLTREPAVRGVVPSTNRSEKRETLEQR